MSQLETFRALRRFGWGTDDEKEFLHGLGRHTEKRVTPRIDLLRRYEMALGRRSRWGGISYALTLAEVRRQIREEERRLETRR